MMSDDTFLFDFPIFAFLVTPGPRPGAIRDTTSGTVFVPLWTDRVRFEAFIEEFQFGAPVCGLQIDDRVELTDFLDRFKCSVITQVAIDPDARQWLPFDFHEIEEILRQDKRLKPR
ncbi:MAG: hypothetical protein HY290_23965 [Planctomycetia bacterium]|nr:hypothetical protein [Planctomycetia bacterium]